MNWIFYAVLARLFWGFGDIASKYVLNDRVKNPYIYLIWTFMFGIITVLLIPFINFATPNLSEFIWLAIAGFVIFFGCFPYIKALQMEDVTRINIWWGFIPIFALILDWVFTGKALDGVQILAFGMMLLGSVVASLHIGMGKIKISKAFWLMVLCCFAMAVYAVIVSSLTENMNFLSVYIWTYIFIFIFSLLLFISKKYRKVFFAELKRADKVVAGAAIWVAFVDTISSMMNVFALSLGPAALVFATEGFQPIFVFVTVLILSLFTRVNLKEEMDKRNMILKLAALALMVSGIFVLNLG